MGRRWLGRALMVTGSSWIDVQHEEEAREDEAEPGDSIIAQRSKYAPAHTCT